jgi:uncharacterized protein YraI
MASRHLRLAVGAILFSISLGAMAENAVTTEPASVRAGPDDSYPEVAQLDADSPIQVMGCLDDWSWCDVTFDGNRGWMYSPAITYEYDGGYVPFYTYAPAFSIPVVTFTVDAYWGRYYHDRPWFRDRDQWSHRVVQHRPPPGPPPHRGPPPREVVSRDRPHGGPPGDHSIRMGNAAPRPEHAPAPPGARDRPPAPHGQPPHEPSHDVHRDEHHGPVQPTADHRGDDHRDNGHRSDDHGGPGSAAPEHAAQDHPTPPHSAPPPHPAAERPAPQHDAHENARPETPRPERREEPPHR